ncbi:hypothetical protein UFOVP1519_35 [uncultured Caudovirales phage]|uniref:IPT/TIG domain-containing protein n=1 Tax=uncultured Caudovirales phage TaxID=2100421 RepID=A0A6J5S987_9CAUD|nr:hypothetical protein UFOVP1306_29 [uncultured Caudovirales phage]CAB4210257.1 hypothetical protein UFOVP1422_31 [uncultured Caudovirales phage]CAB5227360.1 hypothetical protein UFOVP1519_35 [uncultured Caudovirales phage]
MTTTWYLRSAVPIYGPTTSQSTSLTASFGSVGTPRYIGSTAGGGQTNVTHTQVAATGTQYGLLGLYVGAPLQAVSLASGTWTFGHAISINSATSDVATDIAGVIYVWRPATNSKVGTVFDSITTGGTALPTGTTTAGRVFTRTSGGAVTIMAGDVLVMEQWVQCVKTTATAHVLQTRFEGTTLVTNGGSVSSPATAYLISPTSMLDTYIYDVPTVTFVTPTVYRGQPLVSVLGTDFLGVTGVTVGGVAATSVVIVNNESLTFTAPATGNGTDKDVVVTTPLGASAVTSASKLSYIPLPTFRQSFQSINRAAVR